VVEDAAGLKCKVCSFKTGAGNDLMEGEIRVEAVEDGRIQGVEPVLNLHGDIVTLAPESGDGGEGLRASG
jgi:hypothetical protein